MIAKEAIPNLLGNTAYDGSHNKLGKVGHVYVDDRTSVRSAWTPARSTSTSTW